MTDDPIQALAAWLRAQIDAEAEEAAEGVWFTWHEAECAQVTMSWHSTNEPERCGPCNCGVPARRLAEIEAKRGLLELFTPEPRAPETDQQLHARIGHPAYEYRTTEGPRKQWDLADEPPEGDGWERNVDRGDEGWERFDYTEESYWRRPQPGGPRPPHIPIELRLLALPLAEQPGYLDEWRP